MVSTTFHCQVVGGVENQMVEGSPILLDGAGNAQKGNWMVEQYQLGVGLGDG
jgi:hypothetical protein